MTSRPRKALGGGFGWATKVEGPSQDLNFSAELIPYNKRIQEAARILEIQGHCERMAGAKKRGDLSVSLNVDNYFCRDTTRILRNAEVVLTVLIIIRTSRMWFTIIQKIRLAKRMCCTTAEIAQN